MIYSRLAPPAATLHLIIKRENNETGKRIFIQQATTKLRSEDAGASDWVDFHVFNLLCDF